jgi:hypothetical protein
VVNEVYDQALDVRPVVVLVSHYHDRPIPQIRDVLINPAHVEPHDLDQILELLVLQYLSRASIPDIHHLAF